ncbi:Os09g0427125 [Oryza sativa Japonica Group]|uniref:Os09g0427125 protein n=1 Tax=Oryza sativa subsp. japonica TaxID=39947 RepID=C7J6P8_ORYSJ|nr:Os09g0427125 [Oryza sativa Japonica Group]|eukprot:NP_001175847.1 Os09g0427125 [Oryza sativa Japonica Group]
MKRRSMFTVGKNKGVALSVHRKPLQHMVQRRLRELKKIVPDAHEDNVDVLLRQTAEYICILELKEFVWLEKPAIVSDNAMSGVHHENNGQSFGKFYLFLSILNYGDFY